MRPLHWLYAHLWGYFWVNCTRCGRGFGGHQWGGEHQVAMQIGIGPGSGRCVYCPRCARSRGSWDPNWREDMTKIMWRLTP